MASKTMAIIGAGIGGLAAGCYARMNGWDAHIFEMHRLPGGLCTAWSRQGYTLDGCIHHLAGCRPESPLYRMWRDLGAMPRPILFPDDLTQVESSRGEVLTVYTDLDRLERHMLDRAPADARFVRDYLRALRAVRRHDLLELNATGVRGLASVLPTVPVFLRWGRHTLRTVSENLHDPFLRRALPTIQYDWPDLPMVVHLNLLAQCATHNYGFPAGGSLRFAESIAGRFQALGGTLHFGSRVNRILIEKDHAIGVRLDDGTEVRSDAVISNANVATTLHDLLTGRRLDPRLTSRFSVSVDKMTMGIHVSLGVRRDLSDEPHALVLLLDAPTRMADRNVDRISVELYGFDPTLAPEGCSVIKVMLDTSYAHWETLGADPQAYAEAKEEVAQQVIGVLERRFKGLRDQIAVMDVATPRTTERYTGNGLGYTSSSGTPSMGAMLLARPQSFPGLRGLVAVGQSYGGGGLPGCAAMGRNAVLQLSRTIS